MSNTTAAKVGMTSSRERRRSKKSQEVTVKDTVTVDSTETKQESNPTIDKGTQVITMPQLTLQETPEQDNNKISLAPLPGNRPIAASDLKISEAVALPGNRPVDAGNLEVVGMISALGERPIAASAIKVWDTIAVSGNRPIALSTLQVSETEMIMGNRPIASNIIENVEDLMGYLD